MVATWLMWLTLLILAAPGGALAATSFNAQSAMGLNLAAVNYYSSEQPFINSFVTSERWITHSDFNWDTNEEKYLNLDRDGWPMTLKSVNEPTTQQFNSLGVLFLLGMPDTANGNYPAGQYIVMYDGKGKLSYGIDAVLVSRSPGRLSTSRPLAKASICASSKPIRMIICVTLRL
jgi:hypothetical protein